MARITIKFLKLKAYWIRFTLCFIWNYRFYFVINYNSKIFYPYRVEVDFHGKLFIFKEIIFFFDPEICFSWGLSSRDAFYLWNSIQCIYIPCSELGEIMFRVRCSFFNLIYTPGIPKEKKSKLKTFIFHPPRIGTNKAYF